MHTVCNLFPMEEPIALHTPLSLPFSISQPQKCHLQYLDVMPFWCTCDKYLLQISPHFPQLHEYDIWKGNFICWQFFFSFNYPPPPAKQCGTCLGIVNIHIFLWGLCFPRVPQHNVDMAHSYSCSLVHADSLLPPYCLSYLPTSPFCHQHLLSLSLSRLLSIPSPADPFIHGWYIGGYPVCHAWCSADLCLSPKQHHRLNT